MKTFSALLLAALLIPAVAQGSETEWMGDARQWSVGFVGEKPSEFGWRAAEHHTVQIGKLRSELRINERGIDLTVEPVDDVGRSVPGRAEAEDRAGLIA